MLLKPILFALPEELPLL